MNFFKLKLRTRMLLSTLVLASVLLYYSNSCQQGSGGGNNDIPNNTENSGGTSPPPNNNDGETGESEIHILPYTPPHENPETPVYGPYIPGTPPEEPPPSTPSGVSLTKIYDHLKQFYPAYENVTYDKPSNAYLPTNNWLIQTPNIWGKTLEDYNQSFTAQGVCWAGTGLNTEFHAIDCSGIFSTCCLGESTCQSPPYTSPDLHLCLTPAHKILTDIYNLIINAKTSVDIITLSPLALDSDIMNAFATGPFAPVLRNALIKLAEKSKTSDHPIIVRLMEGAFIPTLTSLPDTMKVAEYKVKFNDSIRIQEFLQDLAGHDGVPPKLPAGNKLHISVGTMRSCFEPGTFNCGNMNDQQSLTFLTAYNHGKIINVDSKTILTGGENMFGVDYLTLNPVADLNVQLTGSVANGATAYQNLIWKYVKENRSSEISPTNYYFTYKDGQILSNTDAQNPVNQPQNISPNTSTIEQPANSIKIQAMYTGKLNNGVLTTATVPNPNEADQSESARVFAFSQATKSIKIFQQAVYSTGLSLTSGLVTLAPFSTRDNTTTCGSTTPCNVIKAIAHAMYTKNVDAYIVTSDYFSGSYTSFVEPCDVYRDLVSKLKEFNGVDTDRAQAILKAHLYLGEVRYNKVENLDNIANHSKFWMVDDQIFSVGSHNIYPATLQEFGVILESPDAIRTVNQNYWDPMWDNASKFDLKHGNSCESPFRRSLQKQSVPNSRRTTR